MWQTIVLHTVYKLGASMMTPYHSRNKSHACSPCTDFFRHITFYRNRKCALQDRFVGGEGCVVVVAVVAVLLIFLFSCAAARRTEPDWLESEGGLIATCASMKGMGEGSGMFCGNALLA